MAKNKQAVASFTEGSEVYTDLLLATLPILAIGVYYYGFRLAALYAVGVVTANLCDRLVALLRARPFDAFEMSNESFAAMLVLLLPATVSYYVVIISVLAGVLLGKEAFGGYGAYVFHPTAVGYVVAAVSWPSQVCAYPAPFTSLPVTGSFSVATAESPLTVIRSGSLPALSSINLLIGNYAGSTGAAAVLVVIGAAAILLARRRLRIENALLYVLLCGGLFWLFPLGTAATPLVRLQMAVSCLCAGALPFAAVFFLSDPITTPNTGVSRTLYVCLFAVLTVIFNYYGYYDNGACFALLMCNSVTGWIDRIAEGRFLTGASGQKGGAV